MYNSFPTKSLALRRQMLGVLAFFIVFFVSDLSIADSTSKLAVQKDEASQFQSYTADYTIPNVKVIRQDAQKLDFVKEIDDGRTVILDFVFVSCSAICPMLSHVFSKVQEKLTKDGQKFHLISISIDPENDTPASLIEYGKKFSAGESWDFYTGTREASLVLQKAFNAYKGDKMKHASLILMRSAPNKSWLRLEGFASPDTVVSEYYKMQHPQ